MRRATESEKRLLAELARHPAWKTLWLLLEDSYDAQVALLGRRAVQEGKVPDGEVLELRGYHRALVQMRRSADNAFRDVYGGEVIADG